MNFPNALKTAVIKKRKVCLDTSLLTDDDLVEYMQWKSSLGVSILTPYKLRSLHRSGHYVHDIYCLFKNSKQIDFLAADVKPRTRILRIQ